jgi:hypothetical protein
VKQLFSNMKVDIRKLPFVLSILALGLTPRLGAAPGTITIATPDFIIPLGGEIGTLDLFSDGREPQTSGFNVLGRQRLTLQENSVSTGTLTLNLHFSEGQFEELPAGFLDGARLQIGVRNLDFLPRRIASGAIFHETAALSAINGVPLAAPMSLANYLPQGTTSTRNQSLTLDPLLLRGPDLPATFSGPLVLSFTLTATLATRQRPLTVFNTPESIPDVRLTFAPEVVPEPSTPALLGLGALWLLFALRRRR